MCSGWSADRFLAVLAAVIMEAAWLALAYLIISWMGGARVPRLGIAELAAAAAVGLLLARVLRRRSQSAFAMAISASAVAAAGIGSWLAAPTSAEVLALSPADFAAAVLGHPAGWLLGVAVLRGTAHADTSDEGLIAAQVLTLGMPWLVVFWFAATMTRLAVAPAYAGPSLGATLTFVSGSLIALGLSRLAELKVEFLDRGARLRWVWLLLGITGALWAIGLPLSALLHVPLETALTAGLGPLGPLLIAVLAVLAIPVGWLLQALLFIFPRTTGNPPVLPQPVASHAAPLTGLPPGAPPDLTWLIWVLAPLALLAVVFGIAAFLRRPAAATAQAGEGEIRTAEAISLDLLPRLPRLRLPRWRSAPRTAVEAYLRTLTALAAGPEARRAGETPREHSARVAASPFGSGVSRLAVDYQLAVFGGRRLNAAEEKRAILRWRRITRRA